MTSIDKGSPGKAANLRTQAEEIARGKAVQSPENIEHLSPEAMRSVLHELQVHQIELELQNEELRRAHVELESTRQRYFDLYNQAPVGYVTVSEQGLILEANLTAAGMLGDLRGSLIMLPLSRFIHTEDQDLYYLRSKHLFATGEQQSFDLRIVKMDGPPSWVNMRAGIAQDAGGAPMGRLVMSDITERHRAALSLQESETRYQRITKAITDYIYTVRVTDGHVTETVHGPGCLAVTGYHADEFANDPVLWHRMVANEDRSRVEEQARRILAGEDPPPIEHRIVHKNGTERWVRNSFVPHRDENGTLMAYDGVVVDITERKLVEDALRQSHRMSEELQRITHTGAYECSLTATEFGNNTWQATSEIYKILGIDKTYPHTLFGWAEAIHPDSREEIFINLKGAVDTKNYFEQQHRIIRVNDGAERWVHGIANFEYDEKSSSIMMVGTIQDITEKKLVEIANSELQAQLQQSQKMESLGVLAGGVAHDMNNVLGAILGLASVYAEIQPEGTPAYGAFNTILKAATRGGELVKSLLAFARQTLPSEQELDLNAILQDEVRILRHTTLAKVHLKMELAPDLRHILGDVSALTHAFMNLCVNAVDAMPERGILGLRTRNVDRDWIEVVVEDNGTGMSEEVLAKAIDPFFTTKGVGKGTGLGLPMVYTTVRAHHGQLDIQSEPGQGTRVRIRFPACAAMGSQRQDAGAVPVERGEAVSPTSFSDKEALTVLVVDDDEMIRVSMQTILDHLGHTVILTRSGEEALAKLEARFEPDIVILDMNMPGLGGFKTLSLLRSLRPGVPVILATGRVDEIALTMASTHPGVTLLPKPFGVGELQKHLETLGLG